MIATSPEQVIQQFLLYLNDGNLEGALALYEPNATFVSQPGEVVQGLEAIRSALAGFVTLKPKVSGEIQKVLEADETALVINEWNLEGTQPDGTPMAISGRSADVLRRQTDGTWRLLIDDPWGASYMRDAAHRGSEKRGLRGWSSLPCEGDHPSRPHRWEGRNERGPCQKTDGSEGEDAISVGTGLRRGSGRAARSHNEPPDLGLRPYW